MTNEISKFLDLTPLEEVVQEPNTTPLVPQREVDPEIQEIESNVKDLIDVSKQATAEMYTIATSSQQSGDYAILAKMIKTTSDVNKDLYDIKNKALEAEERKKQLESGESATKTVHNTIVFQGTTKDMLKQIEGLKK